MANDWSYEAAGLVADRTGLIIVGEVNSTYEAAGLIPDIAVAAVPDITAINPAFGPVAGGTLVTITGNANGFEALQGLGFVTFGGVPVAAGDYVSWNDIQIVCRTPAGAAGAVAVFVQNNTGNSDVVAGGFTYIGGGDEYSYEPQVGIGIALSLGT